MPPLFGNPNPLFDPRMALYDGGFDQKYLEGYGSTNAMDYPCTPHDMKPPRSHGLTTRRQLNAFAILTALAVPVAIFVATSTLMSSEFYYRKPGTSLVLIGMALMLALVIGVGAVQSHRRRMNSGEHSWWSFIFVSSLLAVLVGTSLGYINYSWNTKRYYDWISLRKAVGVDPAENQGQQMLDAGEIDFKAGAKVERNLNMAFHKTRTWCIAPIVSSNSMATYDFWAVGMDCCSARKGDFSCAPSYKNGTVAAAGLRVMDDAEIAGYKLALEQASSAYNIQSSQPIFLYMMAEPYRQIKEYYTRGKTFSLEANLVYLVAQAMFVAYQAYSFGKGAKSGYMDSEKSNKLFRRL